MPTTVTASEVNPLKAVHVGLNVVRSRFVNITTAASFTVSDIALLARVPNKATVVHWRLHGGNGAAASTGTWKLGIAPGSGVSGAIVDPIGGASMTDDSLHAAMSLTTSAIYSSGSSGTPNIPFKVSLSDGANPQYVWIAATSSSGSFTGTTSLNLILQYTVGDG